MAGRERSFAEQTYLSLCCDDAQFVGKGSGAIINCGYFTSLQRCVVDGGDYCPRQDKAGLALILHQTSPHT